MGYTDSSAGWKDYKCQYDSTLFLIYEYLHEKRRLFLYVILVLKCMFVTCKGIFGIEIWPDFTQLPCIRYQQIGLREMSNGAVAVHIKMSDCNSCHVIIRNN